MSAKVYVGSVCAVVLVVDRALPVNGKAELIVVLNLAQ